MSKGYKIPNLLAPKVWAGSVDLSDPAIPAVTEFYSDFESAIITVEQVVTGRYIIRSNNIDIFVDGKTIILCSLPLLNSIVEGYITGLKYQETDEYLWRFYDSTGTEANPCSANSWLLKIEVYP